MPTTQRRSKSFVVGTRELTAKDAAAPTPTAGVAVAEPLLELLLLPSVLRTEGGGGGVPPTHEPMPPPAPPPLRNGASASFQELVSEWGLLPSVWSKSSTFPTMPMPARLNSAASLAVISPPPRLGGLLTKRVPLFERCREGGPASDEVLARLIEG